jgi:hypothetical protein
MRIGKYIWWCGGLGEEGSGPEYLWDFVATGENPQVIEYERVEALCSSCGRLAPFQNGCRWVSPIEFRRMSESGDEDDDKYDDW